MTSIAPTISRADVPQGAKFSLRPRCCEFCHFRGFKVKPLVPYLAIPSAPDAPKFLPRVFWMHNECAEDLALVRADQITLHPIK